VIVSSFPRIPHLPGSNASVEDLVLDDERARLFLSRRVIVYEKLDGLNVTFDLTGRGRVTTALKSEWNGVLAQGVGRSLQIWIRQREDALRDLLQHGTLYGEWMRHRVHVPYDALPDAFLGFALWRRRGGFMQRRELDRLLRSHGVACVAPLSVGRLSTIDALKKLIDRSRYGSARMEGVIVELDADQSENRFAKWVDPSYVHPAKGAIAGTKNVLKPSRIR
jgi:hypothetical protein